MTDTPTKLRIEYVALDTLLRWPGNPKTHDHQVIARSMDAFGFTAPITIDEATGRIVAGHGRLDVLQQKRDTGEPRPDRILQGDGDWLVPVVRGIDFGGEDRAKAYVVTDNRSSELGGWDTSLLADYLQELGTAGLLDLTGYSDSDVDAFLAQLTPPDEFKAYDEDVAQDVKMHACPQCGHRFPA